MVIGGFPGAAYYDVELIDLTGQGRTCRKPDDIPVGAYGAVAAFIDNRAISCSGYNSPYIGECYEYNPSDGSWDYTTSMTTPRQLGASTIIDGQWLITGGYSSAESDIYKLASTEYFDAFSNSFVSFKDLDVARSYHNLVTIDNNQAILAGGNSDHTETYILNIRDDDWSTNGPPLQEGRHWSAAGSVTFANGSTAVLVTGGVGTRTTEVLYEGATSWIYGPDLPLSIETGNAVQYENTFIVVGGYASGWLDTLYKFDVDNWTWILLDERLALDKDRTAVIMVPDEYC